MRFYVFCESDEFSVDSYVIAEVVRDDTADRSFSFAASLAGPRASILTRRELMATPDSRRALEAWDARDDTMFERDSILLARTGRVSTVRLHVVEEDDTEPPKRDPSKLPRDPKMRETVLLSRGLREVTRQVMQRAHELRVELAERMATDEAADDRVG